jgi:hypothetical protein
MWLTIHIWEGTTATAEHMQAAEHILRVGTSRLTNAQWM